MVVQAGAARLPHRIHMVGIGGAGLSPIARVLAAWGHALSGSDLRASPITEALNNLGIITYVGHNASQVAGAELVVISSAIPENNVEVQAARRAGVPVIKRQQLLGEMMVGMRGVGVAGTHGKTTTTAMIALILERLGFSPTFIVGGIVPDLGTNAQAGRSDLFVIEADEYDHMFYGLCPKVAVVTNIEMDHPDCYRDIAELREAFGVYLERVPQDGCIVACADSPELMRLLRSRAWDAHRVITYGLAAEADYVVQGVAPNAAGGVTFQVAHEGRVWGECVLLIPGAHNALNATAALLAVQALGVGPSAAGEVLATYHGTLRRFEVKGQRDGIVVIDDYAHHPTEVRATLAAARQRYGDARIWAVFQPHTYSRIKALLADFAGAFADADEVIVTEIYAARAHELPSVSPLDLVVAMHHPRARYMASFDDIVAHLRAELRAGDILLTLGAGDGYLIGERVLAER